MNEKEKLIKRILELDETFRKLPPIEKKNLEDMNEKQLNTIRKDLILILTASENLIDDIIKFNKQILKDKFGIDIDIIIM